MSEKAAVKETLAFQTEVSQLLHLMIHSLYSNKDIFLRELISNASDACDKLRFEALENSGLYEDDSDLKIKVSFDKDKRTVTIADNGIGMDKADLIEHIGTIAKSGTKKFLDSLSGDKAKDAQLIGQFGVGFYSSFIVADQVVLETRKAGDTHAWRWESAGEGEFSIEELSDNHPRGTSVTLHLRADEDEFLNEWKLKNIISTYSDHISLPVLLEVDKPVANENSDDKDTPPKTEKVFEQVNKASALWRRSKNEISDEEYQTFYKSISHDFNDALAWSHNRVEGKLEYTSLLYIPKEAPFDLYDRDHPRGVKLYVNRVFIMDNAEQLLPRYLRFVKGLVDSNDLPLNVSREILQSNRVIDSIRAGSVKKVLGLLESMAKDEPENYSQFWQAFGNVLKEGPSEDFANKEQIAKLLRFASTHNDSDAQTVSLDDYIERMQSGQEKIYYISADGFAAAKNSPHLEVFKKKGIEVILLYDRVDEWLMAHLNEYNGKAFQSVAKGELDLDGLSDKEDDKADSENAHVDLVEKIKKALGDKVTAVKISKRLTESPACLVTDQGGMSAHLERLLKEAGQYAPASGRVLEINPAHQILQTIDKNDNESEIADWSELLYEQSVLLEGEPLENPADFVKRLNRLMKV